MSRVRQYIGITASEVRIIAGEWRGRKLPVLNREGLRPTADRVRETLFNWLMPYVVGARCLDCFAGSGALGLEALSRGANYIRFFEKDRTVVSLLEESIARLKTDKAEVEQGDCLLQLKQSGEPFDIVFLDPPFDDGMALNSAILLLESNNWLAAEAWIYLESAKSCLPEQLPESWQTYREKSSGNVSYALYRRGK